MSGLFPECYLLFLCGVHVNGAFFGSSCNVTKFFVPSWFVC